ncbi:MAG: hypothetical protein ACT4QG_06840 [Sporichthyaceae bacterium]
MSGAGALARRRGAPPHPLVAAVPAAIGILLVVVGWIEVSGEAVFDDQTNGLNIAILGALLVFGGCAVYLFAFRRRIRSRITAARSRVLIAEED